MTIKTKHLLTCFLAGFLLFTSLGTLHAGQAAPSEPSHPRNPQQNVIIHHHPRAEQPEAAGWKILRVGKGFVVFIWKLPSKLWGIAYDTILWIVMIGSGLILMGKGEYVEYALQTRPGQWVGTGLREVRKSVAQISNRLFGQEGQ